MAAINSQGVQFFWSTSTAASTAAGSLVGQVASISGPSGSANQIDVTNLGSLGKEYLLGLKDEGEITLECFTDTTDAAQKALWTDRSNRTMRKAVIKFNDAAGQFIVCDAICSGYSFSFGVDNAIKTSISLKLSGAASYSSSL